MKTCKECGWQSNDNEKYRHFCNARFPNYATINNKKFDLNVKRERQHFFAEALDVLRMN